MPTVDFPNVADSKPIPSHAEPVRIRGRKIALGLSGHPDGRLVTVLFEIRPMPNLIRRLTLEPSVGLAFQRTAWYPVSPPQDVLVRKLDFGLSAKYYFLLNRRHPFEGVFAAIMADHFRSRAQALVTHYSPMYTYHTKWGIGIGGNYFPLQRFSFGGAAHICHSQGEDVVLNPGGGIRYIQHRGGFVFHYALQVGFSF